MSVKHFSDCIPSNKSFDVEWKLINKLISIVCNVPSRFHHRGSLSRKEVDE